MKVIKGNRKNLEVKVGDIIRLGLTIGSAEKSETIPNFSKQYIREVFKDLMIIELGKETILQDLKTREIHTIKKTSYGFVYDLYFSIEKEMLDFAQSLKFLTWYKLTKSKKGTLNIEVFASHEITKLSGVSFVNGVATLTFDNVKELVLNDKKFMKKMTFRLS
jgi:hypothetical protein